MRPTIDPLISPFMSFGSHLVGVVLSRQVFSTVVFFGSSRGIVRVIVVLFVCLGGAHQAWGQAAPGPGSFCEEPSRRTVSVDTRGLGVFYCTESPGLTYPLKGAHASARPVFYGAVPAAWIGALILREEARYADAYRLTVSQGATYGIIVALKRAVGRPRPYVRRALTSRSSHFSETAGSDAYTSFPSGHAGVSATLATSWSLSHPKWYVIAPGAVWTTAVSLSRLHLGVHYPSDVLVGAAIGVGTALLVHQVRGAITPEVVRGGPSARISTPPPLTLHFRF